MDHPLYLGTDSQTTSPLQIDAGDLVTHAVCVGMTGSGKTGLCLVLLEELGRQNIPVVAVDTKGDLTNLALLFPELRPADFRPWVGASGDDAETVAEHWRKGLEGSGLGTPELQALSDGSPRRLFTPGSDAGTSINILSGLLPPELDWSTHAADLRSRIASTITALLGLVGVEAEPLTSPEHLLLSHLMEDAWQARAEVSLESLINGVQQPPFTKIGAFEVDVVMPPKERLKLALMLNNLLASPTFQAWKIGAPLSPELFLPGPDGKAPTSILYLAHLQEQERHFFLTLFLEMVSSWMRGQPGSTELRLMIYLDEVLGYLPPHPANPPTKMPLLTLFKQARAFGVGVAVATQNPVDIDYKALTNAGTWLVGRLQTDQDRARLGETLEAAAKGAGRDDVAAAIAGLEKRQFLVTSPSLDQAAVMKSRFAMSYLAGPLTLPQLRTLQEAGLVTGEAGLAAPEPAADPAPAAREPASVDELAPEPQPEPAPSAGAAPVAKEYCVAGGTVPQVLCRAEVHYSSQKPAVDHAEELILHVAAGGPELGAESRILILDEDELAAGAPDGVARPAWLADERTFRTAAKLVADRIYARRRLKLYAHQKLGLFARVGESREVFEARCRAALADEMKRQQQALEEKYDSRLQSLEKRLREEQRQYEQAKSQATGRGLDTLIDLGSAFLGGGRSQVGRRLRSVGRATQRTRSSSDNVQDQLEDVEAVQAQIAELMDDKEADEFKLQEKLTALLNEIQETEVAPRRDDIRIEEVAIVWVPRTD